MTETNESMLTRPMAAKTDSIVRAATYDSGTVSLCRRAMGYNTSAVPSEGSEEQPLEDPAGSARSMTDSLLAGV